MEFQEMGREKTEELWTFLMNTIDEQTLDTIRENQQSKQGHTYASEWARKLSVYQRKLGKNVQAATDPDTATMLRRSKDALN